MTAREEGYGAQFDAPDSEDVGPEDRAKHALTQWLQDHGAEVYWEKQNPFSYPTFYIENTTEKPDLLVEIDGTVLAIETKSGRSKAEVYDAADQLIGYWFKNMSPDNIYVVDSGDRMLEVDVFVTATKHSIDGHLFPAPDETLLPPSTFSDGREYAIEQGWIPPLEYNMTEQHVRMLWRYTKKADVTGGAAVGSLLSTALEPEWDSEPAPAVLLTHGKKQEWRWFL